MPLTQNFQVKNFNSMDNTGQVYKNMCAQMPMVGNIISVKIQKSLAVVLSN